MWGKSLKIHIIVLRYMQHGFGLLWLLRNCANYLFGLLSDWPRTAAIWLFTQRPKSVECVVVPCWRTKAICVVYLAVCVVNRSIIWSLATTTPNTITYGTWPVLGPKPHRNTLLYELLCYGWCSNWKHSSNGVPILIYIYLFTCLYNR